MRVFVVSDRVDYRVCGVFMSKSNVLEYVTASKDSSVLSSGAHIEVYEADRGLLWHGDFEWIDGELTRTHGEYVYQDCEGCGKSEKRSHLIDFNRCGECLLWVEEDDE